MRLSLLDLMLGREKIPDGFTTAFGQTVDLSIPGAAFRYQVLTEYWFNLSRIVARFTRPTDPLSAPSLELLNREYSPIPADRGGGLDFRLVAQPSEAIAGAVPRMGKNYGDFLDVWYSPGSVIEINVKNYVISNPAAIEIAAIGRKYLKVPT